MASVRGTVLAVAFLLTGLPARAQEAPRRRWGLDARVGVLSDSNINHLLVNSVRESDVDRPDTVLRTGAGANWAAPLGRGLRASLSYDYDRYDHSRYKLFSYDTHALTGDLYPRIAGRWSLDLGGDLERTGDRNGLIATQATGRVGAVWAGPGRRKVKTGFEYRRDRVALNPLKNGDSRILYLTVSARTPAGTAYGAYRAQAHATAGPDFSYHAHSLRVGLIARPAPRVKLGLFASYADRLYDEVDSRFLVRRRDRTATAALKPALTLLPGLTAVASFAYARNVSNVGIKAYVDRQAYLGLEARY